jgi:hypothetical protein
MSPFATAALPFAGDGKAPDPEAPQSNDAAGDDSAPAGDDKPHPALGQTAYAEVISPLHGMALPFEGGQKKEPEAPPLPELSLERYASLCACCEVYPERTTQIHQQYDIVDQQMRRRLDDHWRTLLEDPALRTQFDELCERYRQWYRQVPG